MTPIIINIVLVLLILGFIHWIIKQYFETGDAYNKISNIVLVGIGIIFVFQFYSYFTSVDSKPANPTTFKKIETPQKEFVEPADLTREEKAAKMKEEAEAVKKDALEHYDSIEPLNKK